MDYLIKIFENHTSTFYITLTVFSKSGSSDKIMPTTSFLDSGDHDSKGVFEFFYRNIVTNPV